MYKAVILKTIVVIALSFTCALARAQVNLVMNPSFEEHDVCPDFSDEIKYANHWMSLDSAWSPPDWAHIKGGVPDYLNECAGYYRFWCGVPSNFFGYHYARTGTGMANVTMFYNQLADSPHAGNRDYLQGHLYMPLVSGKSYCVTFHVVQTQGSGYNINHIGAYLDDGTIDTTSKPEKLQTEYIPQVSEAAIISDTFNWTRIQGNFVATGTERLITIGNFTDTANTDFVPYYDTSLHHCVCATGGVYSFYLVDDISVIPSDAIPIAGPYKAIALGDSALIGDTLDTYLPVYWYANGVLIDSNKASLYVHPDTTTTYVVALQKCSDISYDTVIVRVGQGPCRPKICMIDYNLHDDSSPNADMTAIKSALPDILIDNTPGGYWHGGCLPPKYTPHGIKVFSYITGGYEGTKYGTTEDNLAANLARVNAIAADSATGVFLDEVSSSPDSAGKAYLTAIYNECIAKGLKLIVNPGVSTFDAWLMGHSDYLMSDEHYNGSRILTSSESSYASRILVVDQGITSAASAVTVTQGAWANGFGYSYACDSFTSLPSWLSTYMSLIIGQPATPAITLTDGILHSSAPYGNQWYEVTTGIIPGATSQAYTPSVPGTYYDIVTLTGCSSDTSNAIHVVPNGIKSVNISHAVIIYPNPTKKSVTIEQAKDASLIIYNTVGVELYKQLIDSDKETIDISYLPGGVYFMQFTDITNGYKVTKKVIKE